MDFLIFLLIVFAVIGKVAKNRQGNGSSGKSAGVSRTAAKPKYDGMEEQRSEQAKEASRRQTHYSYEHNTSDTLRKAPSAKGGNKAAKSGGVFDDLTTGFQQVVNLASDAIGSMRPPKEDEEGTARPGSMDPKDATPQGVCIPGHDHGGQDAGVWNPGPSGSMRMAADQPAEGQCDPDHQHGFEKTRMKSRLNTSGMESSLESRTGRAEKTPVRRAACAQTPRFSENEIINGMIWGEILKRPGGRRASRIR